MEHFLALSSSYKRRAIDPDRGLRWLEGLAIAFVLISAFVLACLIGIGAAECTSRLPVPVLLVISVLLLCGLWGFLWILFGPLPRN